jgi:copper resistance protein B
MKRPSSGISLILGLTLMVPFTTLAQAQVMAPDSGTSTPVHDQPPGETSGAKTLPNLSPARGTWPQPVDDKQRFYLLLVDQLEYQRVRNVDALSWNVLGWYGQDVNRLWVKSEGTQYPSTVGGGDADVQVLYGRLISPFFDVQTGIRYEEHTERDRSPKRAFLVLGLQGLSPYSFDLEPTLFLSDRGKLVFRFSGTYDLLLSQRLILQPRVDTEIAASGDKDFGAPRGVNEVGTSARLRYEIRREFAPYIGVGYQQSYDIRRTRIQNEGGSPNGLQLVFGIRMWH